MTLVTMALAGAVFLSIQTTTNSVDAFLVNLFKQYDPDVLVQVTPRPDSRVKQRMLQVPNVAAVERFENGGLVKTRYGRVVLIGTEAGTRLYHYDLRSGRLLHPGEMGSVLLSENVARRSGIGVGAHLGVTLNGRTERWRVVGVVQDDNTAVGAIGCVFASLEELHQLAGVPAGLGSAYMVQARDRTPAAVDRMASDLDASLASAGLAPTLITARQNLRLDQQQSQVLYVLFYAVAAIVAGVGLLSLFNTLATSVIERRREIGVMRSMGASGRQVASVFLTEALGFVTVAWVIAVAAGVPLAYGFVTLISDALITVPFTFNPAAFAVMLAVMCVVAALASLVPALSAARLRVADTLRYE
jgi:putative ABC transport system permease protein